MLPKLNFDYDKNINEILNDINLEQNKSSLQDYDNNPDFNYNDKTNSINNDIIKNISRKKDEHKKNENSPINCLIKNKKEQIKEINKENKL